MPSLSCQQDKKKNCKLASERLSYLKCTVVHRHYAIADYLKSQGFDQTLESFMKDCSMVSVLQALLRL